jgi:peptidoglycan hydrolase-like protein with peptidoglycan-binding domain
MKSILLASVSVVAFAGAAAAEVAFSGTATFGYNDDAYGDNEGFYWESDLAIALTQELNNGLTAGVTFDIDIADDDDADGLGNPVDSSGFVLYLTSEQAGIYFGDTSFAAQKFWFEDNVDEMAGDGFSEQDGEIVLRGDITYGSVEASLSYTVADTTGERPSGDVDQLSLGAGFAVGGYAFTVAYQEESDAADAVAGTYSAYDDFNTDSIFGVAMIAQLIGVDAVIAYASNLTAEHNSLGIAVSYPVGPFALNAYYVAEDGPLASEDAWGVGAFYENGPISVEAAYKSTDGEDDSRLEATYDIGNGILLWAGVTTGGDDYYVATTLDLGGGAQLLVSYAVDDDNSEDDEVGNPALQAGATVELTLAF